MNCSYQTPGLAIPGVKHSGDIVKAPYPDGARETCVVNFAALLSRYPKARYVVLAVYNYSRQEWDALEDASVFVANPNMRGTGPGGVAVIAAARLTGAATTSISGYLDLAPKTTGGDLDEVDKTGETSVNSRGNKITAKIDPTTKDEDNPTAPADSTKGAAILKTKRIHFVFTDQEARVKVGAYAGEASSKAVGSIVSGMQKSRELTGAQSLADAAAFQAALVCDKVHIIAGTKDEFGRDGSSGAGGLVVVRGSGEDRLAFFERISAVLDNATPTVPAVGQDGLGRNYPGELLRGGVDVGVGDDSAGDKSASVHKVFFGGDLDDWLEVTREYGMYKEKRNSNQVQGMHGADADGDTLTLVNVRSSERGWTRDDDTGILRVNGATAYQELVEAMRDACGGGATSLSATKSDEKTKK